MVEDKFDNISIIIIKNEKNSIKFYEEKKTLQHSMKLRVCKFHYYY